MATSGCSKACLLQEIDLGMPPSTQNQVKPVLQHNRSSLMISRGNQQQKQTQLVKATVLTNTTECCVAVRYSDK